MPPGNGLAVIEMMSTHPLLCEIPVIVLTGKNDESTIRRCHELLTYFVAKGADVWSRIAPLLKQFLVTGCEPDGGAELPQCDRDKCQEVDRHEELMDAVFTALGCTQQNCSDWVRDTTMGGSTPPPTARPRVLCIDVDEAFSFGLKLRLKKRGVDVVRASKGREGYRTAFFTPTQAILLDYEMPDGNGDYVLRRLKENRLTNHVPVIVLTGRREKSLERKMFALGASGYITKPFDWARLWDQLQPYLQTTEGGGVKRRVQHDHEFAQDVARSHLLEAPCSAADWA